MQTDHEYFRALLLDDDVSAWTERAGWLQEARDRGWRAKPAAPILAAQREKKVTSQVIEIAEHFEQEIKRMAQTAVHTAAYADGQTVLVKVKEKELGFTREQLEVEIADLLKRQNSCCALTGYEFKHRQPNPHLRPSLDRKDSARGYVPRNLQIVTRAANFYKSASDEADWALKAKAMRKMAVAMQQRDGVGKSVARPAAVTPTMASGALPVAAPLPETQDMVGMNGE